MSVRWRNHHWIVLTQNRLAIENGECLGFASGVRDLALTGGDPSRTCRLTERFQISATVLVRPLSLATVTRTGLSSNFCDKAFGQYA